MNSNYLLMFLAGYILLDFIGAIAIGYFIMKIMNRNFFYVLRRLTPKDEAALQEHCDEPTKDEPIEDEPTKDEPIEDEPKMSESEKSQV